jgi:hypothetical protein
VMSCSSLSPSFISCRCGAGAKSMITKGVAYHRRVVVGERGKG